MKDPILLLKWFIALSVIAVVLFGEIHIVVKFPADSKHESSSGRE
jgi:hypothetical protein